MFQSHPPVVTQQGTSSPTFHPPPIDGSISLVEMLDYNAAHSPNHPLIRYEGPDGSMHDVVWSAAVPMFHRTGRLVRDMVGEAPGQAPIVVGVLAPLDPLTLFNLIIGIMRAGYVPFTISPRFTPAAIAHLLGKTGCRHWFVSGDANTQRLAGAAVEKLDSGHRIKMLAILRFSDMLRSTANDSLPLAPVDLDQPCVIMHSSGSTSLPKPITITHRMIMPYGTHNYLGEIDYCGEVLSAHGLPMFHIMGFLSIPWTTMTGVIAAFLPPSDTPRMMSPPAVLGGCVASKSTILLTIPAFLEAWVKNPSSVDALKQLKSVQVSGGPLQPDTGDFLVAQGVKMTLAFGMTEIGVATVIAPGHVRKEGWKWLRMSPHVSPAFLPVPEDDKLFRLVFKKCSTHTPAVINTSVDGVDAFDSNDLVMRHPVDPTLWAVYGRDDDQITHSTGEKTNPAPLEAILERDPHVSKAVMFGRSKFQAGVLIMPAETSAFDPADQSKLADFRTKIWDTVKQANENAPQHSRIFKEMIIVAHAGKPFELTGKGTLRRKAILEAYKTEIDAAYAAVDHISRADVVLPESWDMKHVREFVGRIVRDIISPALGDNDDIFLHGGDSLSATSIRSSILLALRKSKRVPIRHIRDLPPHFVFDLPSITGLSAFVYGVLVTSVGHVGKESLDEDDDEIFDWQTMDSTSTIIKLRQGKGEVPLIVLHGVAGSIIHFKPFQERFKSALWAIQITKDTPLGSVQEQAAFYYQKIKEELPHGPYRLASLSASSYILVLIVLMLEANGDKVIQAAMLDHFPTSVHPIITDFEKLDAQDPECQRVFVERGLEVINTQLLQEDRGLFPNQRQYADQIRDLSQGKPASEATLLRFNRMKATLLLMLDLIVSLAGPRKAPLTVEEAMEALRSWIRGVKVPLTVFAASNGMVDCLPQDVRKQWRDLGAKQCNPNIEVVTVDGGHFGILADERVIATLQSGYI